jgi:hypothetical protein
MLRFLVVSVLSVSFGIPSGLAVSFSLSGTWTELEQKYGVELIGHNGPTGNALFPFLFLGVMFYAFVFNWIWRKVALRFQRTEP